MGEERDIFGRLGCNEEVVSLDDPHNPFNASSECERKEQSAAKRFHDEYVMTPFSQSTQAWKWRVEEEERQQYADKSRKGDVVEVREEVEDVDNTVDEEEEDKEVVEKPKSLSFRESMRGLSPHRLPLGERMKDRTISYVDLLRPDPVRPPRSNEEHSARASRSWACKRRI